MHPGVVVTPAERSLRARMAAHHLHAQRDPRETTAPARSAFLKSFMTKVDPDGVLPVEERERRANSALRAHMARLSLKSAEARLRLRKGSPANDLEPTKEPDAG
ncbi:MAG: hypothetical protein ACT4OV_11410 [Microthrixaceae bacterium]